MPGPFVDIHCHVLPGIDDGAGDFAASLAMARMAAEDGTQTIIATPHQLGSYRRNQGADIRALVAEVNARFAEEAPDEALPNILPGGDVRIEDDLPGLLDSGEVLTLGDHRKHVLLELPHEIYFPLEGLLERLAQRGMVGILSHPERNRGIQRQPEVIPPLVAAGCLMQVTGASLLGTFGEAPQAIAEAMVRAGDVHFLASDGHSTTRRRPLLQQAYLRAAELVGPQAADEICCQAPAAVAKGQDVPGGRRPWGQAVRPRRRFFGWAKAGR